MREVDRKVGTMGKGEGLYLCNGRMGASGSLEVVIHLCYEINIARLGL